MRRLPIYFVLDCSESMVGEPITSMEKGLAAMLGALRKDPYALETAYIGVITFATTAKPAVPLTELSQFQMPKLVLGSGTSLGAALELLEKQIAAEVAKNTTDAKGDYKPIVFLLTDGEPTDRWEAVADRFKKNRGLQIIAVGCGADANPATLRRISEFVILAEESDQETFTQFFKWVSASVATASQTIEQTGEARISLEKIPKDAGLKVADESTPAPPIVQNRFVFLHCRCTKSKKFYLMKFVRSDEQKGGFLGLGAKNVYKVAGSFPLDDFEQVSTGAGISVSTDQLDGNAPCPHCHDPWFAYCRCGKIHCCPELTRGTMELTCPWCGTRDMYGLSTGFNVGGGGG